MKQALISPNEQVSYLSSWTNQNPPQPVFTQIPNSARVAEVAAQTFPVSSPLFWIQCADNVIADEWYYNVMTKQLLQVPPPAPYPEKTIKSPVVEGVQTL